MAKEALKTFEQRIWEEIINSWAAGDWVDNVIADSKRHPDAPFTDSGPILERMLSAGVGREEIGRLIRSMSYETAFSLIHMLEEEGLLTRRAQSMHESLLEGDPSGMEGRPGSWPITPQASRPSPSAPLKIPKACDVVFSPDGRCLLAVRTTNTSGILQLWDYAAQQVIAEFKSLPNLRGIAWSPDSATIAAGSHDGTLCVHEAITGKMIWKSRPSKKENCDVGFSSTGKLVLASGFEQYIRVFDAADGTKLEPLDLGSEARVVHMATSRSGDVIAATFGGKLRIFNLDPRREVAKFQGGDWFFDAVSFLSDGHRLMTRSYNDICIWNAMTCEVTSKFQVTKCQAAAMSNDDSMIAISESEGAVKIIDGVTGELSGLFPCDAMLRRSLSFSPDHRFLAVASSAAAHVFELSAMLNPPASK